MWSSHTSQWDHLKGGEPRSRATLGGFHWGPTENGWGPEPRQRRGWWRRRGGGRGHGERTNVGAEWFSISSTTDWLLELGQKSPSLGYFSCKMWEYGPNQPTKLIWLQNWDLKVWWIDSPGYSDEAQYLEGACEGVWKVLDVQNWVSFPKAGVGMNQTRSFPLRRDA